MHIVSRQVRGAARAAFCSGRGVKSPPERRISLRPPISSCIFAGSRGDTTWLAAFRRSRPHRRTHSRPASRNGRPVTTPCRARSPRPKNRVNHSALFVDVAGNRADLRLRGSVADARTPEQVRELLGGAWIDGAILSRFPRTFSVPSPARTSRQWSAGSTMPSATAGPRVLTTEISALHHPGSTQAVSVIGDRRRSRNRFHFSYAHPSATTGSGQRPTSCAVGDPSSKSMRGDRSQPFP